MGQRKLGLKRPYQIDIRVSAEEDEYIARVSWEGGISKAELLRSLTISRRFQKELVELRIRQIGIPGIYTQRPSSGK